MSASPLRYLSAADVNAAMPDVEERLALARKTMIALGADAELPPKIGVHPRQAGSHTAAMPALLRGADRDGADDLIGVKWVAAFPDNRARGLPGVSATVILSDPLTGEPVAILDGAPITAQRTAAVSGVALREWWPAISGTASVAIVGAGVQGASHVEVLAHVAPGCVVTIADRDHVRAHSLADLARGTEAFADVSAMDDIDAAVRGADVVLTMIAFGEPRQIVPAEAFARAALVVAVDYDMCLSASVVAGSRMFLVDDIAQFEATRTGTVFAGYPQPDASIGQALSGSAPAPRAAGPVVIDHLGVGLADVVFADAIVRRAAALGLGIELPR